jgi:hypothetical protein
LLKTEETVQLGTETVTLMKKRVLFFGGEDNQNDNFKWRRTNNEDTGCTKRLNFSDFMTKGTAFS